MISGPLAIGLGWLAGLLTIGAILLLRRGAGRQRTAADAMDAKLQTLREEWRAALDTIARQHLEELGRTSQRFDDQFARATSSMHDVQKHLVQLGERTQQLLAVGKDVVSLQELLRAPKLRGAIGELTLGWLLAQVLPHERFAEQYTFRDGTIVDAVIFLDQHVVPIDAKFPLEAFQRMTALTDEAERQRERREFIRGVKKHIDAIAEKYIQPDQRTSPFALMYIPAENVYYETAIRHDHADEGLYEYAMRRRVFVVSPQTFYPYLVLILLGFKGLSLEAGTNQLLQQLDTLLKDLERFGDEFGKTVRHVRDASKSVDRAERLLDRIQDRTQHLATAGTDTVPAAAASDDARQRELASPAGT